MSLQSELRRLSGTTLDMQGAANAWAGTTGLSLVGALNVKAGTTGIALQGVLARITGTNRAPHGALVGYVSGAASPGYTATYTSTY